MENFAWFNGQKVAFTEGQTILQVARQADIFIPTLCAFMPLNHTPGTCRMCLVEVFDEGDEVGRVVTACTTPIKQGQRIFTRNERVRKMQQLQMQLLFADHDQDCKSCSRHGNCGARTWPFLLACQTRRIIQTILPNAPMMTPQWASSVMSISASAAAAVLKCAGNCEELAP